MTEGVPMYLGEMTIGHLERPVIERLFDSVEFQGRRRFGHFAHHSEPGSHRRILERTGVRPQRGNGSATLDDECRWRHLCGKRQRHFGAGGGRRFARGAGWQHAVSLHAFDEPVTDGKW